MRSLGTYFFLLCAISTLQPSCCWGGDKKAPDWHNKDIFVGNRVVTQFNQVLRHDYASIEQISEMGCQAIIDTLQDVFENKGRTAINKDILQLERIIQVIERKTGDTSRRLRRNQSQNKQRAKKDCLAVKRMMKRIIEARRAGILTYEILQPVDGEQDDDEENKWRDAYEEIKEHNDGGPKIASAMEQLICAAPFKKPRQVRRQEAAEQRSVADSDDGQHSRSTLATEPAPVEPPPVPLEVGPPAVQPAVAGAVTDNSGPVPPSFWTEDRKKIARKARNWALGIAGTALLLDAAIRQKKSLLYGAGKGVVGASKAVWHWLIGKNNPEPATEQLSAEETAGLANVLLIDEGLLEEDPTAPE